MSVVSRVEPQTWGVLCSSREGLKVLTSSRPPRRARGPVAHGNRTPSRGGVSILVLRHHALSTSNPATRGQEDGSRSSLSTAHRAFQRRGPDIPRSTTGKITTSQAAHPDATCRFLSRLPLCSHGPRLHDSLPLRVYLAQPGFNRPATHLSAPLRSRSIRRHFSCAHFAPALVS